MEEGVEFAEADPELSPPFFDFFDFFEVVVAATAPGGMSHFLGLPRFFLPVKGSMGLLPLGTGFPSASKMRLLGGGTVPSGLGLGGRPRRFLPVTGSIRMSTLERGIDDGSPPQGTTENTN